MLESLFRNCPGIARVRLYKFEVYTQKWVVNIIQILLSLNAHSIALQIKLLPEIQDFYALGSQAPFCKI